MRILPWLPLYIVVVTCLKTMYIGRCVDLILLPSSGYINGFIKHVVLRKEADRSLSHCVYIFRCAFMAIDNITIRVPRYHPTIDHCTEDIGELEFTV